MSGGANAASRSSGSSSTLIVVSFSYCTDRCVWRLCYTAGQLKGVIRVVNRATAIEQTLQLLQQRGHRVTGPRRRVVEAAQGQAGPFTADYLLQQLQDAAPVVGRATVFC